MQNDKEMIKVELPEGVFCGNCTDCVHYQNRNTDKNGRGYCAHFGTYYFPQERNGCFHYVRR